MLADVGKLMGARRKAGPPAPVATAFTVLTDATNTAGLVGGNKTDYVRNGIRYVGSVSVVDGKQYVLGIDIQTGTIVSKSNSCSAYTAYKDDHNPAGPWLMPDGVTAMALASAHNVSAEIRMRRTTTGDPADWAVETTLVTVATTTYPTPLEHPGNGDALLAYRGNAPGLDWFLSRSQDNGATWSNYTHAVWHDSDQTYCRFSKIAANEYLCHASNNPAVGSPNVYSFRVNTSTGNIRNAAGTTIANFITGVPVYSANASNADLFYTAPTGWTAGVGEVFADNSIWYFNQVTDDGQFGEWWISRCTTANFWNPADWVHSKICEAGYGVGLAANYTSLARAKEVVFPGITQKLLAVSQLREGVSYCFIMAEQTDHTWKNVLYFNEAPQVTNHSEYIHWPLGYSDTGKLMVAFNPQDHNDYNAITNASVKFLRIDALGNTAPVITYTSSPTVTEYKDFKAAITTDQPCGINIVGGADAANFEIVGGKYLRLNHAANFDAPHDANADNQFVVQVKAMSLSGQESAAFTITLTITALTKTGGVELFTQTADLTNAAWTANAVTRANDSTDVTDPDGGNTMDKIIQTAAAGVAHNLAQTLTLTASTKYTEHYEVHPSTGTSMYFGARRTFGAGGSCVCKFDLVRGRWINHNNSVIPSATFCMPLANGNFEPGMTYTAPVGTASGTGGPAIYQFAGPNAVEDGVITCNAYVRKPTCQAGDYKTHVVRTT